MKRLFTCTLLALTTFNVDAQNKDGLIIEDRPLTWDDFRGRHKSEVFDAVTFHSLALKPEKYMPGEPIPAYNTIAYFVPKESSVDRKFLKERNEEDKLHLLKHEQGHYDLSIIAARQMNEIYKNFNFHPRRSMYQADSIFRIFSNKLRIIELKYDKETNHSKIKDEQARWNTLIAEGLNNKKLPE